MLEQRSFQRHVDLELEPTWRVWALALALGGEAHVTRDAAEASAAATLPVMEYPHGPTLRNLGVVALPPRSRAAAGPSRNEECLQTLCDAGLRECVRWLSAPREETKGGVPQYIYVEDAVRARLLQLCCAKPM